VGASPRTIRACGWRRASGAVGTSLDADDSEQRDKNQPDGQGLAADKNRCYHQNDFNR